MKKIKAILKLISEYKSRIVTYFIFNILSSLFNVFSIGMLIPFLKVIFKENLEQTKVVAFSWNPDQLLAYFDYKLSTKILEWGQFNAIVYFSIAIVVLFFLKNLCIYLFQHNLAFLRSVVVRDMRAKTYKHLLQLPLSYFGKNKRGELISKLTSDVQQIEISLMGALELVIRHPIAILFPLISLFIISYELTLFVLVLLPISGYLISRLGSMLKKAAAQGQHRLGEVLSTIEESLHGIKIIKGFNAQKERISLFEELNDSHFKLMVRLHRRELMASPLSEFMGSIVIAAILVFSGNLIVNGEGSLTGAYLISYIAIFSQIISPAKAITESYFKVMKADASLDRIKDILKEKVESISSGNLQPEFTESIVFENVDFSYDDKKVLKSINLEIKKGQTVALVGPSGGGKSTLVDLLPRFISPQGGSIKMDGKPIEQFDLDQLRSLFGIVTQDAILFNDTVAGNIKMGNFYSTGDDLLASAKIANAHDFILEKEGGYNANLGEKGGNLSGGQKQRISIARAILQNPPVLILDEATSALDTESEKWVQDALEKVTKDRTSLVIAHRLSTIQNADVIVVLDNGEIKQKGSHKELMEQEGVYKKLVNLQTFE